MTPQEKATELINSFLPFANETISDTLEIGANFSHEEGIVNAKKCATLSIGDNIKTLAFLSGSFDVGGDADWWFRSKIDEQIEFLEQVKKEIIAIK